jgi:hypothetical protein
MSIAKQSTKRLTFDVDAAQVLGALRTSIANVLATAGGVRKPADLQKSFKLDGTLSWQIFQISGMRGGDGVALARGANVPSRTSLKKFLEAAKSRGIDAAKVERVWSDYERFEKLVDVHAGDRTSFNSMVSAAGVSSAGNLDDEWMAANAQHARNAFRSMSHATGMQAKTKMICGIYNENESAMKDRWDISVVVGYVGLRLLRPSPTVQVFRIRMVEPDLRSFVQREPLGLSDAGKGYLLEDFATKPLPAFAMKELDAGWLVGELNDPDVGNLGASTMPFGVVYRHLPIPGSAELPNKTENADVVADKPVELILCDCMVKPGMMRGARPTAEVFLGNRHNDAKVLPGDLIPLLGDHRVELLGKGPEALASADVPQYPDMIQAAADKLGWDVSQHEVWRIRIEYPFYQATVRMKWELP